MKVITEAISQQRKPLWRWKKQGLKVQTCAKLKAHSDSDAELSSTLLTCKHACTSISQQCENSWMRWRLQLEFFPLQTFGSNRYFFLKHLNWNSLKFAPPELQRGVRSWLKFFLQCSVVTCWNTPSLAMVLHFVELLLLTLWSCSYQCTDAAEMYFVARLPLESQHQNLKCHSRQLQLPCETPSYQSTENLRGRGTRELAGGSWGALICSVGVVFEAYVRNPKW